MKWLLHPCLAQWTNEIIGITYRNVDEVTCKSMNDSKGATSPIRTSSMVGRRGGVQATSLELAEQLVISSHPRLESLCSPAIFASYITLGKGFVSLVNLSFLGLWVLFIPESLRSCSLLPPGRSALTQRKSQHSKFSFLAPLVLRPLDSGETPQSCSLQKTSHDFRITSAKFSNNLSPITSASLENLTNAFLSRIKSPHPLSLGLPHHCLGEAVGPSKNSHLPTCPVSPSVK